jgi:hypothetical protein
VREERRLQRSRFGGFVKVVKQSNTKKSTLVISSVVFVGLVLIGWIVISHWGTTGSLLGSSKGRSSALQLPGVVRRQGGGGMEMQATVANCAKGFVRQGSTCERDATTQVGSSGASNSVGLVRPPERQ